MEVKRGYIGRVRWLITSKSEFSRLRYFSMKSKIPNHRSGKCGRDERESKC